MIRFNRRLDFRDGRNTSDLPGFQKRTDCNKTFKDVGQRRSYDIGADIGTGSTVRS